MKIGIDKEKLYNQLQEKIVIGLEKRLNSNISKKYEDRLNYELGCIKGNIGIMRYLLAVSDIVDFANRNNILMGNGQGSSNSSLINYALSITNIDPIKYDLIFENFFNAERLCEIDIDLECEKNRIDIITDYIKNNYDYTDIIHFKIDILNCNYLDKMQQILNLIGKPIDFNNMPLDDEKVYKVFSNANTKNIPQFESSTMCELLTKLKPTCFEDLVVAISLNRPSCQDLIDNFIDRRNNKENISYIDISLKDILEPTFGLLIYHEQVLAILKKLCGYSYNGADIVRRNILKNDEIYLKEWEDTFSTHVNRDYINYESTILKIYNFIVNTVNKTFLKSHAISVALFAYQMAYLKVYYNDIFKQVMENK